MTPSRIILRSVLAVVVCLTAAAVEAQPAGASRPQRPYRGLFGGNTGDRSGSGGQTLDLHASLYGGYDDNVLQDTGPGGPTSGVTDPRFQAASSFGGGDVSLSYSLRRRRIGLSLGGGTYMRYYPSSEVTSFSHNASVGFTAALSRHTSFQASQSVTRSPFYTFNVLPPIIDPILGSQPALGLDYGIAAETGLNYNTSVSLQRTLGRKSILSVYSGRQATDYESSLGNYNDLTANIRFTRTLTRDFSLHAGYAYRKGRYDDIAGIANQEFHTHSPDLGVDFNRGFQLKFSKRTTFESNIGSAIIVGGGDVQTGGANGGGSDIRYFVSGNAMLIHEIGRTWDVRGGYVRSFQYVAGFGQPIFTDALTGGASGALSERLDFSSSIGYSFGNVGFASSGNGYDTLNAGASLQFALNRFMALFTQYFYYHYFFESGVALPIGLAPQVDRNGVRAGLNLYVPLIR